jgi:hypothetical protein
MVSVGDVATGCGLNTRISRQTIEITVECLGLNICGAVAAQLVPKVSAQ